MRASLEVIQSFLACKSIAIVGVSRDPRNLSVKLFEEFQRRGYDVVAVNPNLGEFQGRRCFRRVQEIRPPVEGALLMTPPETTDVIVRDCAEAGINNIWMYRAGGRGAVSSEALRFCTERGMKVVPGECPFMFWPDAERFHRWHGLIRKITGRYPRRTEKREAA